jgi:hypothetical protein
MRNVCIRQPNLIWMRFVRQRSARVQLVVYITLFISYRTDDIVLKKLKYHR